MSTNRKTINNNTQKKEIQKNEINNVNEAKQPKSLTWLFMTEVWERFAYWSLYSLLVLYMVKTLHLGDTRSYLIFAAFNGLLYTSPIIGGWLADRYLSANKALQHGCVWLILGYVTLAMSHGASGMYVALALLIWGNGLFKPNVGAVLGSCYKENDSRRQRGFTIYYMGINIGATIGVLGCGWISMHYGWKAAFLTVAAAMILGMITYICKLKIIKKDMLLKKEIKPTLKIQLLITVLGAALVLPLSKLLAATNIANLALISTVVGLAIYLCYITLKQRAEERSRMLLCIILTVASIAFWALYMQMGSSLTMYMQRCVDLHIWKHTVSASSVCAVNGIWLLLLSPVMVTVWRRLNNRSIEPKTHSKFIYGILLMAAGYAVLAISAWELLPGQKASLTWVIGSYGLQTLGELCLSPIGLAMVTELVPEGYKSLMMGVWFLATAIASVVSGQLAKIAAVPKHIASGVSVSHLYAHAFTINAILAVAVALLLLALTPVLKRLLTN